ncbi:MAG: acyl-CoA dehydrogenase [Gammaproteobacteria bacterium]|nr:acyl-CoA dehydrogenase [Gammaproteobacteria bacterium]
MQFAFTDDQNLIRETAREFLTERASVAQLRKDCVRPEGHDPALWQAMTRELGWAGIALPESTGGSGLGMVELAILLEEQGRGLYGGPFLASAGIASALLLESAASEMRDAILSRLASGEASAAAAITGDTGRYDELDVAAELIERDGRMLLQGYASFVLNGHTADIFVVVAHDRRVGKHGLALVAIEAGTAGLEVKKLTAMDLTRPYGRLVFKDARPQAVLADGGTSCVACGLQIAQVALAAEQLGAMQAVLELTTGYTSQRVQFGRVIGSFQAIKHRLADMMVVCEAARSAVYYAACVVDEYRADPSSGAQELAEAAALVKVQCSTGFHEVAGNAIQLHGGIGFTWEYDTHLFFKRARATINLLGHPQNHRERIASLIGLDASMGAQ